jgi:tricarballylate dehydrogenase
MDRTWDVIVVGGGNAALCAALAAHDGGATVLLLEGSSRHLRGGNSRHTRNIRTAHRAPDAYVTAPYLPDEMHADVAAVTGGEFDSELTSLLVEESLTMPDWMVAHGVRWQPPLRGTLGLARTNRFFLGGGKALVNAYFAAAQARGIEVRYQALVTALMMRGRRCEGVVVRQDGVETEIAARAVVIASGGFEANIAWLGESWGAGAGNFIVRGTPANDGAVLRMLFDAGASPHGDPGRFHAVAVDARSPRFDGGIITRIDAIPMGIAVNRHSLRFYDEGEDIWPKRYAIWGRLIAEQEEQEAFAIVDSAAIDRFIPPVFPPLQASTIGELAAALGIPADALCSTVQAFNASVVDGTFRRGELDDCRTQGLVPPKSHWARRIDTPPYYAFPLRPGITFTYHGVGVDDRARVRMPDGTFDNLFAAGEIMAGTILSRGYLAGLGMTIGSVFGRIAGRQAAGGA